MYTGSWVGFCVGQWVMGHCLWPIACSALCSATCVVPNFVAVGQSVSAYAGGGAKNWGTLGPRPIWTWAWLTPRNVLLSLPPVLPRKFGHSRSNHTKICHEIWPLTSRLSESPDTTKCGAERICRSDLHWSVLITWLIRILSLSPSVCIL